VALKILSPEISHKSDVGGVALNIETGEALRRAADAMLARVARLRPGARVTGLTVQQMVRRPGAHELIVGASTDPLFGPVILFGHGGTAVEVIADRAVALPPLNEPLARALVAQTRVSKLLAGYRDRPRADHGALYLALVKVAQLVADIPEIVELDVNPLLADERGVLALDARIAVAPARLRGAERLAIRPYPKELEERIDWEGRELLLRPIRPEDEAAHLAFLARLDPEDIRMRIFMSKRQIARSELARLTQIDYDREMAFIATARDAQGAPETLAVVRAAADPDNERAEFGIIVRSDLKGRGLGTALLAKMLAYCRERGTGAVTGEVLRENRSMLALTRKAGFEIGPTADPGILAVRKALR